MTDDNTRRFYVQPEPHGDYSGATGDEYRRWLKDLAEGLASTDVLEIAICDEVDEQTAADRQAAQAIKPCDRKLILVMNVSPCRGKLLDPGSAAHAVVFDGPGTPLEGPGA